MPSGYDEQQAVSLVVMLHGCTQSPDDFAAGTQMNTLAEEQSFLVAYPRQSQAANASSCWDWFRANDRQVTRRAATDCGIHLPGHGGFLCRPKRV